MLQKGSPPEAARLEKRVSQFYVTDTKSARIAIEAARDRKPITTSGMVGKGIRFFTGVVQSRGPTHGPQTMAGDYSRREKIDQNRPLLNSKGTSRGGMGQYRNLPSGIIRERVMFTSAECRARAEQKLKQAESDTPHRRRLIARRRGLFLPVGRAS